MSLEANSPVKCNAAVGQLHWRTRSARGGDALPALVAPRVTELPRRCRPNAASDAMLMTTGKVDFRRKGIIATVVK